MIKASHILEEYLSLFKHEFFSIDTVIYLNPDRSDFKEMGSEIRFIANTTNKKVYAWNANESIHQYVAEFLDLRFTSKTFWGEAEKQGGSYIVKGSDTVREHLRSIYDRRRGASASSRWLSEFLSEDWSWVNRYFDASSFFKNLQLDFLDIV
jgi:hypothetical protein